MMYRVKILHQVIADHKDMFFDDSRFLSAALLSISFHCGVAKHHSDVETSLVDVEVLGLYFIFSAAGITLLIVVNADDMPGRVIFQ